MRAQRAHVGDLRGALAGEVDAGFRGEGGGRPCGKQARERRDGEDHQPPQGPRRERPKALRARS